MAPVKTSPSYPQNTHDDSNVSRVVVVESTDGIQNASTSNISINPPNCEDDAHELWKCRGLALGCGEYVVSLKKCFNGEIKGDCRAEQVTLGKCVKKNALELEQRIKAARTKTSSS